MAFSHPRKNLPKYGPKAESPLPSWLRSIYIYIHIYRVQGFRVVGFRVLGLWDFQGIWGRSRVFRGFLGVKAFRACSPKSCH